MGSGIRTGRQYRIVNEIRSKYACEVIISNANVCDNEQTRRLYEICKKPVGVWHLAAVLHDGAFATRKEEEWEQVVKIKRDGAKNLDQVARSMKLKLETFFMFSSIACDGNPGQTNYVWANTCMEEVCKQRVKDGLNALAVRWGGIGSVGILTKLDVANTLMNKMGIEIQSIDSSIKMLDRLLQSRNPVVSCYKPHVPRQSNANRDPLSVVLAILGFDNPEEVEMSSTFEELGLDSIQGVELQNKLKTFNVHKTLDEIKKLKVENLKEQIEGEKKGTKNNVDKNKRKRSETQVSNKKMKFSEKEIGSKRKISIGNEKDSKRVKVN